MHETRGVGGRGSRPHTFNVLGTHTVQMFDAWPYTTGMRDVHLWLCLHTRRMPQSEAAIQSPM